MARLELREQAFRPLDRAGHELREESQEKGHGH